ncbi:expressed unknown protein [Seminavis robusta]|uniref:Uncharacterized protein n=1 Tax=Seminavis robusta TaxID=568900 RepID=A0A9N8EY93_9STRA|nr:expressed unknown protein [Seminavis robusta]|eukprot:Sro2255_g320950.1 n/a (305) ;mRNA; f:3363-4632
MKGAQTIDASTDAEKNRWRSAKISKDIPSSFVGLLLIVARTTMAPFDLDFVLEDPANFGVHIIAAVDTFVVASDYGSPTDDSVDTLCKFHMLEAAFVREVYYALQGKCHNPWLSDVVNDAIFDVFLRNVTKEQVATVDEAVKLEEPLPDGSDLPVELALCIRYAIDSGESTCLNQTNMATVNRYLLDKKATSASQTNNVDKMPNAIFGSWAGVGPVLMGIVAILVATVFKACLCAAAICLLGGALATAGCSGFIESKGEKTSTACTEGPSSQKKSNIDSDKEDDSLPLLSGSENSSESMCDPLD